MSAFAGILHSHCDLSNTGEFTRLAARLSRIGPDGQAQWSKGPIGLTHSALLTSPGSEKNQQPHSFDGNSWIVGDVRLDSRAELLKKLGTSGSTIDHGLPDIQLVLHAWGKYGKQVVNHIAGDYSFIIWDHRSETLFCARDHLGVIPFYFARIGDLFVFSNILNFVKDYPGIDLGYNEESIVDFLVFGLNTNSATTAYKSIRQLPPAHTLEVRKGKTTTHRYWTLPVEDPVQYKKSGDYVEHFSALLTEAVSDRISASNVAVSMSGGLDSTSLAVLAHKLLQTRNDSGSLKLFTLLGNSIWPHDEEGKYASEVAEKLSTPIEFLGTAPEGIVTTHRDNDWHPPEPELAHPPAKKAEFVSKISEFSRVALAGHGGDPLLTPNPGYLPSLAANGSWLRLLGAVLSGYKHHRQISGFGIRARLKNKYAHSALEPRLPPWLRPEVSRKFGMEEKWSRLYQLDGAESPHPTRPQAHFDLSTTLWPTMFAQAHPGYYGIPVKFRFPYMDLRIVRFCLRLPPIPWCRNKYLLRCAMTGQLPNSVLNRPKTPLPYAPYLESARQIAPDLWRPPVEALELLNYYLDIGVYENLVSNFKALRSEEASFLTSPLVVGTWMLDQKQT